MIEIFIRHWRHVLPDPNRLMLLVLGGAQLTATASAQSTRRLTTTISGLQTESHRIIAPDGFVTTSANGRSALCAEVDRDWVTRVIAGKIAATRPAVPVDQFESNLASHRAELRSLLVEQLAVTAPNAADEFIDHQLTELIKRLCAVRVRPVYLVLTHSTLKSLVQSGWGNDQFHYNRVADKVIFDGEVTASLDGAVVDSLVPALYQQDDPPDQRSKALAESIQRTETGVAEMISRQGQSAIESTIGEFVLREGLLPLKLDNNEDWFDAGVVGVVAASGLSVINGQSGTELIAKLIKPSPLNPVRMDSIDLAHPVSRDQLRPQLVQAYADTFRRRSVKVIAEWLADAGPTGLNKTIMAIREGHPADNTALLSVIQKQTGIDLTAKLLPGG